MRIFLTILATVLMLACLQAEELLTGREWRLSKTWNAAGTLTKLESGALQVENTGTEGSLTIDCAEDEVTVIPGKNYLVTVELEHVSPEIKHSLFVALPGARRVRKPELRTSFETGRRIAIEFTTRPDERRMGLYLSLSGTGKTVVKSVQLEENNPSNDLLKRPGINWSFIAAPGSKGKMERMENGSLRIEKSEGDSHVMAYLTVPLDIKSGKSYRVTMRGRRSAEVSRWGLMSHTGSQKSWPNQPVTLADPGKEEKAVLEVTAADGDSGLRVYAVLHSNGHVEVDSITVEELSATRDILPGRTWTANPSGSQGKATKLEDGSWQVTKDEDQGAVVFTFHGELLKAVPGKFYRIEWQVKLAPGQTAGSMVYLPRTPKARTPWPVGENVVADGGWQNVVQNLDVQEGEQSMRLHLVVRGQAGQALVKSCLLQEISEEEYRKAIIQPRLVEGKIFEGPLLKKEWEVFSMKRNLPPGERKGFYYDAYENSGIFCKRLNWCASEVKMIELAVSSDQPTVVRMDFVADDNGKNRTSYLTYITYSDGLLHNLRFEVGDNPSWTGIIKEIKITCRAEGGTVGFERLHALPEDNLIPFAKDALPLAKLENLRPRGQYLLKDAVGATIRVFDRDNQVILQEKAAGPLLTFTAPELTVTAEIANAPATACLNLLRLRPKELPDLYWRGAWIWCQNGFGPNNTSVWFEKVIQLGSMPEAAQAVMTADDSLEFFVNGKKVGDGNNHWTSCVRFDLSGFLQPGENRIVAKAHNVGAWGGYIGELYLRENGQDRFFPTGADWRCHIGGETLPKTFEGQAFVLGAPPAPPWGTRPNYLYVGPKAKLELVQAGDGRFTVKALDSLPADLDELVFRVQDGAGQGKLVSGVISPSTGKWTKGQAVEVTLRLPEMPANSIEVKLESDCLEVVGNPVIARIQAQPKQIPKPVTARVVTGLGTRPWIDINGEKYNPIYYDGFKLGKDWMLRDAVAGGNRIVRTATSFDAIWKKPGEYDFTEVDSLMGSFALNAPEVKVILLVKLAMPQWWCDAHPDDVVRYDRDQPIRPYQDRQALASKRWLKEGAPVFRALLQHILQSPYADRVFAIGLSEGWNSEWFWSYVDRFGKGAYSGYSQADYETFTGYLKEWYGTKEAFARAWNIPDLSFENFTIPSRKELDSASVGTLLDPVKDRRIIDWFRFRNRSLGEAIEHFGKVVKEESGGKWLVGVYYGYFQMFCGIYNRLQSVGHLDVERLSRSPYVDLFWAPSNYNLRRPGLPDGIMQAAENLTAHGKLVVVEQDMRTFCENDHYEGGRMRTVELTIGAMERAFGLLLSRGVATHWLSMHDSWFREKVILDLMRNQQETYAALPPVKGTTPAEICIVSDTESAFYTQHNQGNNPQRGTVYQLVSNFNFVGAPFSHLYVKDLNEPQVVNPHKMYIMTNLFALDKGDFQKLMERFDREGATVLWLYAAGISTPTQGPSADLMGETLGLKFKFDDRMRIPSMTLTPELGGEVVSNPIQSGPWFLPVSGFDKVLGQDKDGQPMLVQWRRGRATHYFSVIMRPSIGLLRSLAKAAGVQLYAHVADDPILVGNDVLFLHAKSTGRKTLLLPTGRRARAISGPLKGNFSGNFSFDATAGRTYGFLVE